MRGIALFTAGLVFGCLSHWKRAWIVSAGERVFPMTGVDRQMREFVVWISTLFFTAIALIGLVLSIIDLVL